MTNAQVWFALVATFIILALLVTRGHNGPKPPKGKP